MSRGPLVDMVGVRSGRLLVVSYAGVTKQWTALWLCKCDCGRMKAIRGVDIRNGHAKTCGCSRMPDLATRFWSKVPDRPADGYWNWAGGFGCNGYGKIKIGGGDNRARSAHRVSWELNRGPIPEGLTIDHLCFNKKCVNPDHLEPVTTGENTRRYVRMKMSRAVGSGEKP